MSMRMPTLSSPSHAPTTAATALVTWSSEAKPPVWASLSMNGLSLPGVWRRCSIPLATRCLRASSASEHIISSRLAHTSSANALRLAGAGPVTSSKRRHGPRGRPSSLPTHM